MVLVFSETVSTRLEYITKLIFNDILLSEVILTDDPQEFLESPLPKINYSGERSGNELFLKADPFLFTAYPEYPVFKPVSYTNGFSIFESSSDSFLPFDLFAASFFLVSRIEEYRNGPRDSFGRFPAEESIAWHLGFLEKPVVNQWAWTMAGIITAKYPGKKFRKPDMQFISTIDIDNAWAYLHKGFFRNLFSVVKSGLKGQGWIDRERFRVLTGKSADPYDNYEYLQKVFSGNESKVIFFFLMGNYGTFDKSVHRKNRAFQKLIRNLTILYKAGIHPSYRSSLSGSLTCLLKEKARLEKITGKIITKSRQHYLRLSFPETYRNLLAAGITEDYSMGFAGHVGFRAGICTPFLFYDLIDEKVTPLRIFPFQVMDVTLQKYMHLEPFAALQKTEQLIKEVADAGGVFISLWHNETLSNEGSWQNYRQVFETMNYLGFQYGKRK